MFRKPYITPWFVRGYYNILNSFINYLMFCGVLLDNILMFIFTIRILKSEYRKKIYPYGSEKIQNCITA